MLPIIGDFSSRILLIAGGTGVGKTTLARALVANSRYTLVSTDQIRSEIRKEITKLGLSCAHLESTYRLSGPQSTQSKEYLIRRYLDQSNYIKEAAYKAIGKGFYIVEGIHVLPLWLDQFTREETSVICLARPSLKRHMEMIRERCRSQGIEDKRYLNGYENIQMIATYIENSWKESTNFGTEAWFMTADAIQEIECRAL